MDKDKTFELTATDLQNIIGEAMKGVAGAVQQPQSNVVQDIALANQMDQRRVQNSLRFNQRLLKEELVLVSLPVSLADYFGDSVTVSVNGNTIKIPIDGNSYRISKPHNQQLQKKIMYNNVQLSRVRKTNNRAFGNVRGDIGMVPK